MTKKERQAQLVEFLEAAKESAEEMIDELLELEVNDKFAAKQLLEVFYSFKLDVKEHLTNQKDWLDYYNKQEEQQGK